MLNLLLETTLKGRFIEGVWWKFQVSIFNGRIICAVNCYFYDGCDFYRRKELNLDNDFVKVHLF